MNPLSIDFSDLASSSSGLAAALQPLLESGAAAALALVVLALVILRGRSWARRRIGALEAELARIQMQILGIERLQYAADEKATRADARLGELERAQQRTLDRSRKPDPRLAMAMARGGADARALVDCGLSHAESHLLRALHAPPAHRHRET